MTRIFSFTALDFRLIKPYMKSMLLYVVLGIAMGIGFKSSSILATFFIVSLMLVMSYPFAISEKSDLDILYATLSLNKKSVVIGRYLFALCLTVLFFVLSFVGSIVLNTILGIEFNAGESIATLCLLSGVFMLILAFQYPIYFKYGYTKARFITLVPMFIVFLFAAQIPIIVRYLGWSDSLEGLLTILENNPYLLSIIPLVLGLITLVVSCSISCRIYTKKDI